MDKSRSNSKQKVETKQVDLDTGMPDLPKKELFAITFAFLGINMAFSLQSSQMSRICQTIGANPNNLGFFFIFPPLMGMIVQPIMGKMSDRTWNRFGRRLPYLLFGTPIAALVLIMLPFSGSLGNEYVVQVKGKVVKRSEVNPDMKTGQVEVDATEIIILNKAKNPPFEIKDGIEVSEQTRLKYRYLDLRRPEVQQAIILRSKILRATHEFFDENGFIDIETPILGKSSPEGARDYLVPSRIYPGSFYALPQSPQLFKQLLMGAGFDKYYQLARCFRDEDLRGDRHQQLHRRRP